LLVKNQLSLKFQEYFENNKIIDVEGYYDDIYKETNLRVRTKNNISYCFSYNEAFQVFNGRIKYDNDIYMNWNNEIFAPKKELNIDNDPDSKSLQELNKGNYLNLFGEQQTIKIKIVCAHDPQQSKIFPHWACLTNIRYHVKLIRIKTNSNQEKTILGNHHRYSIKENIHSVPLKNKFDFDDLRGNFMELEVEVESLENSKIDLFSFINFVRNSYI
jgi:hypothetical protein